MTCQTIRFYIYQRITQLKPGPQVSVPLGSKAHFFESVFGERYVTALQLLSPALVHTPS